MHPDGHGAALQAVEDDTAGIDFDILRDHLDLVLHRALTASRRDFAAALADSGLRPAAFNVLVLVGANPGITQSRLASALSLDKGTLTHLIKDFERRGWVESAVRSDDRRSKGVFLSPEGVRALVPLKGAVESHVRRVDGIFTGGEQQQLLELLRRVAP